MCDTVPKNDDGCRKPKRFESVAQAFAATTFVEQLLAAEQSWITNRLSWLFVSQSFCITAFVILVTSETTRFPAENHPALLRVFIPLLGIICCVIVGVAVRAAGRVATTLANERARLTRVINDSTPATIPLIGIEQGLRDVRWTRWAGALPHWVLPWVLAAFWLAMLFPFPLPWASPASPPPPPGRYQLVQVPGPTGKTRLLDTATGRLVPEGDPDAAGGGR